MNRFASLVRRHRGQTLRLVLTVLFLVLGLSVSTIALSLQQDLVRFFQTMDRPFPLWVGQVRSNEENSYFPVYQGDVDQADIDAVGRLVPADRWTPYFACTDSGVDKDVKVIGPPAQDLQFVRIKVFAKPLILKLFHATLVAGRYPTDAESRTKKYALVSEEVAQTLFGWAPGALGKNLVPVQGNFPTLTGQFEICGVYSNPSKMLAWYGYPDMLFVPDDDLTRVLHSVAGGRLYGTRMAFDPSLVDPKILTDQVVPRLTKAHPNLSLDRFRAWQGGQSFPVQTGTLESIHRDSDQLFFAASLLTVLFLVVSCLSVLSFMFVSITSRAQEIAVERALGRPFGHFLAQAFTQGSLMVLAASVLALAVDAAVLPSLTAVLQDSLGSLLPDSRGQIRLDLSTVAVLCLGSAILSGLVAGLPLLPYRKIPISTLMKDQS